MNQKNIAGSTERIIVALDSSPHSLAALRAAAELAALMEAELEGLFVEDINLLYLCGFPFGCEVGSRTARVRQLNSQYIENQLRAIADSIREGMAAVVEPVQVRWSFQVRRGSVTRELLDAAQTATMLSLGRASQRRRRQLGSTAQSIVSRSSRPVLILDEDGTLKYPLTVLYTGSEGSRRTLRLALQLAARKESTVRVLIWDDATATEVDSRAVRSDAEQMTSGAPVELQIEVVRGPLELLAILREGNGGTLLLPSERASLLAEHNGPTILVP